MTHPNMKSSPVAPAPTNDQRLMTDGGGGIPTLPAAPEVDETVHVFDTRDFDRTESLIEVQLGETRREAQAKISDDDATAPAFEDATKRGGEWVGVDLSKPMHATLDSDGEYPSLVYLGTLSEAAAHLYRMFAASDRPMERWAFSHDPTLDSEPIVDWMQELYELATGDESEVAA